MGKTLVALKSRWLGTYLTACKNQKTVMLQQAEGLNKLPPNSLWMMEKPTLGDDDDFRFISCYGKHLVTDFIDMDSVVLKSCSNWFFKSFLGEWTVTRVDDRYYSTNCFLIKPANCGELFFLKASRDNSVSNDACSSTWEAHCWEIISILDSDRENEREKDDSTSISPASVKASASIHVVNSTQNIFQSPTSNGPNAAAGGGPYCNSGGNVNGSGTQISGDTHYKNEYGLCKQDFWVPN